MNVFEARCVRSVLVAVTLVSVTMAPAAVARQADEIQVYDAGLAPVGVFNLTWHNNYTPRGAQVPAFPGGITSDNALVGVTEWAYGATDWFEAGLYLPLYSIDRSEGVAINGFKLRALFAVPNAASRTFFYGVGFELGFNARRWDPRRVTSEIRPIVGVHLAAFDVVLNPILDTDYQGGLGDLVFAPSSRVAYNISPAWAIAVEEYADLGPLNHLSPGRNGSHQLYGVIDYAGSVEVELGVGYGLTEGADDFTLKLILARDLN
jgi:hypothetical protein